MEKEKICLWKKINKKILINCSLIFIVIISLVIILTVSLRKNQQKNFNKETHLSVKEHIKDNNLDWEYNKKENTFYCKRGPVVFKSESKLLNKHDKGQELIKNLVNWFYENVPWGPEIIYLREIKFLDMLNPSDANGILFESCAYGKRFGIANNGICIFVSAFLKSFDQVNKEYLKNNSISKETPFDNIINKIQYTLYQSYLKMQMNWFFADYSTKIRSGGWHLRSQVNSINLRTEQIYQNRFNDSQKTNWRYPFTTDKANHFDDNSSKELTFKQVYENANNLDSSTKLWSDKKDLYHLNQNKLKSKNAIELIKNEDNYSSYFNGLDQGNHLSNKELSVWEADNLVDEFKNSWLKPFCKEFNINLNIDGTVDDDDTATDEQLIKLINIMKFKNLTANNKNILDQWAKISKYQFRGYSFDWIKEFLNKVILTIIKVNKKISYNSNQKFIDVINEYKSKVKNNTIKKSDSNPSEFKIENKLIDKNENYIAHPSYPASLGSDVISYFDYISNLSPSFAGRDYMVVSMGCNLKNISNSFENAIALNIDDKFWNDISFLKAFNALPYDQNNKVDENLLTILAKVMRIDQDIAMTYKSDNSSLSYMWGYMPENANYKKLVFKNNSETKTIPIYQSKQNATANNNDSNTLDFDHMFYNEKFMDKSSKQSLTKLMKRKAWISDWNLLSDYDNAIIPKGEYKVYFEDEKGNHIPLKNYDDAGLTDYQFKLNAGSEYDCFAQYVFHYDTTAKTMILNVRKIIA